MLLCISLDNIKKIIFIDNNNTQLQIGHEVNLLDGELLRNIFGSGKIIGIPSLDEKPYPTHAGCEIWVHNLPVTQWWHVFSMQVQSMYNLIMVIQVPNFHHGHFIQEAVWASTTHLLLYVPDLTLHITCRLLTLVAMATKEPLDQEANLCTWISSDGIMTTIKEQYCWCSSLQNNMYCLVLNWNCK